MARLIGNLWDGKARNENDIPTKIIKVAKFVLAPILTRIFSKCINEGFYLECLKVTEFIPTYKSGEENICSNYRPISILLQCNKIFERILYDRVYFHLRNISYYPNINLVSGLDLHLHMQLRVFTPIYWVMLIMHYILALYFLICLKHLTW